MRGRQYVFKSGALLLGLHCDVWEIVYLKDACGLCNYTGHHKKLLCESILKIC